MNRLSFVGKHHGSYLCQEGYVMATEGQITRRRMLKKAMVGTSGNLATAFLRQSTHGASLLADTGSAPDPRIQGPFLILSTPFTASGMANRMVVFALKGFG